MISTFFSVRILNGSSPRSTSQVGELGVRPPPQTHLLGGLLWNTLNDSWMARGHQNPVLRITNSSSVILKCLFQKDFWYYQKSHVLFKITKWILYYLFVNIFFQLRDTFRWTPSAELHSPLDVHFSTKKKKSCQLFITSSNRWWIS